MKLLQLKFIALILLFCSMNTIYSQTNFNERWFKIDELEKQGLYREALAKVDELIKVANKELATNQIVKGVFYQLKFNQYITEEDYILGIANVKNEIENADPKTAAILHGLLAEVYYGYYNQNRWTINQRTVLSKESNDVRTWDATSFAKKIIYHYQSSLSEIEILSRTSLIHYEEILSSYHIEDLKKLTLYDFLFERTFNFFSQNSFNMDGPAETFNLSHEDYFKSNQLFINLPLQAKDPYNLKYYAVKLLQNRTDYFVKQNQPAELFHIELKRLKYAKTHSTLSNKEALFSKAIADMTLRYKDFEFVGEAWFELAVILKEQGANVDVKTATEAEKRKVQEAAAICQEVIKRAPNSLGAQQCEALLSQIKQKTIEISTEVAYLPNVQNPCLITYQNVDKVRIKLFPAPEEKLGKEKLKKYIEKTKTVYDTVCVLKGSHDFLKHHTEFALPELSLGNYLIVIGTGEDFTDNNEGLAYTTFWITQMTFQTKVKNNALEILSICRKVGHPLEDVEVKVSYQEYNRTLRKNVEKTVGTFHSDKNGKVRVEGLNNYKSYTVSLKSGKDAYNPQQSVYYYTRNDHTSPGTTISFFTDRKLYRPGQTIYFKGIATRFKGGKNELIPDFNTYVEFLDVNGQLIKKVTVKTNEFGSFEGKFTAPYGSLTGSMSIRNFYGNTAIRVEEYKRPKFTALINEVEGEFQLNDSIPVSGSAQAFAGNNITKAKVVYRVQRTTRYPYWRWWYRPAVSKEILNGETITNNQGDFNFHFKAIPDETIDPNMNPIFNYTITVDIIDLNGETHSASKVYSLGYQSLLLSHNLSNTINNQKDQNFKIEANSLNGTPLQVNGTYTIEKLLTPKQTYINRYWESPDQQNFKEEEFNKMFPKYAYKKANDYENWTVEAMQQKGQFETNRNTDIALKGIQKWKSGYYKFKANTKDKNGKAVEIISYFSVFNPTSKNPIANEVFNATLLNKSVKPGEKASLLLSTSEKHLNVYMEVELKGKTIKEEWIHLKEEQKWIEIPVNESHIGGFSIDLIVLKNNRVYSQSISVLVPEPAQHLNVTLESFRDKLLPEII